MRVAVHWNLQRGGWSIKALRSGRSIGALMAHAPQVALANVEFVVLPGTHAKIIARKRRTVCAYAVGELVDFRPGSAGDVVSYNPFRALDFTLPCGAPCVAADRVDFAADGKAYAQGAR